MYKKNSRNIQRRVTRIVEARPSSAAYICEDDLVSSAGNMSLRECVEERRDLLLKLARLENELLGAKSSGPQSIIAALGHQIQTTVRRIALLKSRIKELHDVSKEEALHQALVRTLDAAALKRIYALRDEIVECMEAA